MKTPGVRSAIATITRFPARSDDASPEKVAIFAETEKNFSVQSVFFPRVIVGVRLAEPLVPAATAPKATVLADIVEEVAVHPTVPVTFTTLEAKAADVPIKVETPRTMIAIAANLDLLDFANIFDSPYFFSQDWMVPDLSQSYLEIAVFCCLKLGLTPVLRG